MAKSLAPLELHELVREKVVSLKDYRAARGLEVCEDRLAALEFQAHSVLIVGTNCESLPMPQAEWDKHLGVPPRVTDYHKQGAIASPALEVDPFYTHPNHKVPRAVGMPRGSSYTRPAPRTDEDKQNRRQLLRGMRHYGVMLSVLVVFYAGLYEVAKGAYHVGKKALHTIESVISGDEVMRGNPLTPKAYHPTNSRS